MMYVGCANFPMRWNIAVRISCIGKLAVTVPCIPVDKMQFLTTYARGLQSVGFRAEVGRRVDCFAAGHPSEEMPPRKKLKQSSLVKEENQPKVGKSKATSIVEDEDQLPEPSRARKMKASSRVEEEDELTEVKASDRPPLSQGVHRGTLS